jgi:protein-tyrosine phosphatase
MIDLHCHLLPGVDDGPKDLEESLAMARIAAADGIQAVVATPHTLNGVYTNLKQDIIQRVRLLQAVLKEQNIPLLLFPGADIHFDSDLIPGLENGEILPINDGKYILLELETQSLPMSAREVFFELRVKGYLPIITHPERNSPIQKNPGLIEDWVQHGALIQITANSLTGGFGGRAYDCALQLMEKGLVHIIASDAHSKDRRPPVLSKGLKQAAALVGQKEAVKMVTHYPELILAGKPLPEKDFIKPPAKKKFFSRLFS